VWAVGLVGDPGGERPVERDAPLLRAPSGGDGGHGFDVPGREAVPANVWLVSPHPGPVRARRAAPVPRGGGPQDDLGAGGATPPPGSRGPRRWEGCRSRDLRPRPGAL